MAKRLVRLDGIDIPKAAKAILSVFPLDSFIDYPVKRMEIDVIGTNHGITMLIDCKHWKKLSNSALNTIVLKQIERVKHYVTKTGEIIAVPVIVTLYQEQIQLVTRGLYNKSQELGSSIGFVDLQLPRFLDRPKQIWQMLGFNDYSSYDGHVLGCGRVRVLVDTAAIKN